MSDTETVGRLYSSSSNGLTSISHTISLSNVGWCLQRHITSPYHKNNMFQFLTHIRIGHSVIYIKWKYSPYTGRKTNDTIVIACPQNINHTILFNFDFFFVSVVMKLMHVARLSSVWYLYIWKIDKMILCYYYSIPLLPSIDAI